MKLVVVSNLTLDGVMQAPGGPDEDRRDGFAHGGWAAPYADEVIAREMGAGMSETGALLLGRRTYEQFAAYWPTAPRPNPFTDHLNRTRKYVASTTLREPLPWESSTLLPGDAAEAVADLRERPGGNLVLLGSGELARSLMARDLVDQWTLLIHPLVLGTGIRLFPNGGSPGADLRLVGSAASTTGVLIATYRPAGRTS